MAKAQPPKHPGSLKWTSLAGGEPEGFLTGGAGPAVAQLLGPSARHVPHLTLAGIALAAEQGPAEE